MHTGLKEKKGKKNKWQQIVPQPLTEEFWAVLLSPPGG